MARPAHIVVLTGAGLLLTAAGSSVYHWHPDDLGLVIDRMGMGVAFAGLLGVAVADRIGDRAALALTGAVLLLAPLAAALAWQANNPPRSRRRALSPGRSWPKPFLNPSLKA